MTSNRRTESGDRGDRDDHGNGHVPSPATPLSSKQSMTKVALQPPPPQQVLVICRNKHWRYISSFHGPWLQLPPEILETIANANYNTPRPRPIDPAVFFDLVKIRRLVDEATNLAVRAASGVASLGQRGLNGASPHAAALGFGFGRPPPQTKLSPERKHRMREQATQKLMRAYCLDEIACSVTTMQSASSLEEVASLVLQRNPQDPDAKYVHFFHEKIPSRQLAECTSLAPLDEIIAKRPTDPEPLRTRATVRVFKGDHQGAVDDLTEALKLFRVYRPVHTAPKSPQQGQIVERQQRGAGRRQEDVILKEEEQPSSLEMQLLFQRAGVYLAMACRHVAAALPDRSTAPLSSAEAASRDPNDGSQSDMVGDQLPRPEMSPAEREAQKRMAEARKSVRQNAKRALRDYTAYLSHFEYSPDLPIELAEDFTRKVNSLINGARAPRHPLSSVGEGSTAPHRIYSLSDLFTASPPSGLPPYPSTEVVPISRAAPSSDGPVQTTTETLTYHPLLVDALHSLLLCHSIIQTSAKELLRHAYMVARLSRLADGYPVFQSSRCPARADWMEVLRAGGNWIQLAGSWEDLCAPAPLPLFQSVGNGAAPVPISSPPSAGRTKALLLPGPDNDHGAAATTAISARSPIDKQRKDRIHQQAVLDALVDDRVTDESSLRLAIRTRQLRAEHDYRLDNAVAELDAKLMRSGALGPPGPSPSANPTPAATNSNGKQAVTSPLTTATAPPANGRRAASSSVFDEGRDYPISSERASAIARWVLEAPPPSAGSSAGGGGEGLRKRRKKPVKKGGVLSTTGSAGATVAGNVKGEGNLEEGREVEGEGEI
ncbi:uncharacterized protein B0T15DRAFT_142482 [Chaetomium strumarium]|uniref:Histidine kinase group protein n=1 Tax=Chaetomium strumarium TaxID=1170767 RepID=A0AAJ0GUQ7_9PEZI|nr:hypothetical protein B0T15DRAFT_142482 [Chaetomium strumarium]